MADTLPNGVKIAAVILAIVSANPATAETLTWTGSSGANGSKWFTSSTENWTNSAGSAVKWSDGNDAYFDDGSDYRDVIIDSAVNPATSHSTSVEI